MRKMILVISVILLDYYLFYKTLCTMVDIIIHGTIVTTTTQPKVLDCICINDLYQTQC